MKKIAAFSMTIAVLLTAWVIYALIPKTNSTEAQRLNTLKAELVKVFPTIEIDHVSGSTMDVFHTVDRGAINGKIGGYSLDDLSKNHRAICKELMNRMVEEGWTVDRCLANDTVAGFAFFKDMGGWVSTGELWVSSKELLDVPPRVDLGASIPYRDFTDLGFKGETFCSPKLGQDCSSRTGGYTEVPQE